MKKRTPKTKSERIVKALQIISIEFMLVMLVIMAAFIIKNDISVTNIGALTEYLTGNKMTIAIVIVLFTVIKAFALIFPPIVLYFVAGVVFENGFTASAVGFIGSALSLIMPYYLGRFTGKEMLETMKKRYRAVGKLDNFTGENTFSIVFAFKVGGLMPSDLSSLIFGAMNVPFGVYFIASNLGLLVLNISWSIIGVIGDFTHPLTYVCMLPIGISLVGSLIFMYKAQKKKNSAKPEDFVFEETEKGDEENELSEL